MQNKFVKFLLAISALPLVVIIPIEFYWLYWLIIPLYIALFIINDIRAGGGSGGSRHNGGGDMGQSGGDGGGNGGGNGD